MTAPAPPWVELYRGVVEQFAADGTIAEQAFGFRTPMGQATTPAGIQAKISWVPGDDTGSNDAGKQVPTLNVGSTYKALGTFEETFTVYLEAVDLTSSKSRTDDLASYAAVISLRDAWFRAMYYAAYTRPGASLGGRWKIVKAGWLADKRLVPRGACLRLLVSAPVQIPDLPVTLAPLNVEAELTGKLVEDVDEDFDLSDPDAETQRTDDP
jgi:hypothetical protein